MSELTDFAMVDPGLLGLNLFRPLPRKNRDDARRRMFDVETVHAGRRLRVAGSYTLGADDLSVLLAVLGLGGLLGQTMEAASSEINRVTIVDGLESRGEVVEATHIRVRTTLYALCREAGIRANGPAYDRINECLWRMNQVGYGDLGPVGANARRTRAGGSQRLLGYDIDEASREVTVVINARFAAVLLGAQFVRVNLCEARELGEMGRLLHLRLSVMVREGRALTLPTDQLAEWIYGSVASSTNQRKERRREVRSGMMELGSLAGWSLSENRKRLLTTITRGKLGTQRAEPENMSARV